MRRLLVARMGRVVVLSYDEITADTRIEPVATVVEPLGSATLISRE